MAGLCEKLSATPADMALFGFISTSTDIDYDYLQMSADTFSVISDWYHAAIMELTFTKGFKADHKWIARKLSITPSDAKAATERLLRLGLILEKDGTFVKTSRMLSNHAGINGNAANRELQRQIIEKALLAVDECKPERKDISSMTMAIDVKNLDRARKVIREFRRDLCALLEEGQQTEVYNLGIQLYPVTEIEE